MPRPIWSGAISFGLVNIPVKLVTAVRKQDVRFHQLHAKDGVRIQQRRVCPDDGEEVPWSDLVKGYEIAPGRYVVIEPDELEALDPEATHTIDIEDFVALDQVDPVYLDTTYYAVPDAAGPSRTADGSASARWCCAPSSTSAPFAPPVRPSP
jgi:DNA end-binding protein Ku